MPLVSENFQKKKLKQQNINIKTKYIVKNSILEKNTDDSYNDDIINGIRCEKLYFVDGKLKHSEKIFDSRIEYTFVSKEQDNLDYTCPNCGVHAKVKDFIDGCPYCRTNYNIDYVDKDLGSKYHYDRVLRNTTYRVLTFIIDIIVSLILAYTFIVLTSRTFNLYDISKVFIYGFILSLILYYFFYLVDAYIILEPIKRYKDKQNKKQIEFWNRTKINKHKFLNNLNYELKNMYYNKTNVIDFDIIDFDEFSEYIKDNTLYVKVKVYIRLVSFYNNKFSSKFINEVYVLKKTNNDTLKLNAGVNMIKCSNCGSSIDATKGMCEYCHTPIKSLQEWILEK